MTDPRRDAALDTARDLFLRFGYRKTSMSEVARAVGLSRQGLYLWFPTKEALFIALIDQTTARAEQGVRDALSAEAPLETRVLEAFLAFLGPRIGVGADAMDELLAEVSRLLGDRIATMEAWFLGELAPHLPPRAGVSSEEIAHVLFAVSSHTKHRAQSVEAYRSRMEAAIRLAVG